MSEYRIAATLAQGYRQLGLQGQPLISAYAQMTQILRNRLGREHADLFARPNVDPASGAIEWLSPHAGAARKVATLPEYERAPVEALAAQLIREIRQLADKLRREGPSAELVGKMLELAVDLPPGDWLYEIEGKPILIMWGHAPEAAGTATVPATGNGIPPAAATAAVAATNAATATVPVQARRSAWRRWWWLGLLLLLLLALVLWWFWQSRGETDTILGTPRARSAAIDEALARQRDLLAELEALRKSAGPPSSACLRSDVVRIMPPGPGQAPDASVPGPAGPGSSAPGGVEPNLPGSPPGDQIPSPRTGPLPGEPPRGEPTPGEPPRGDPTPGEASREGAQRTVPPRTDPPVPPKPEDTLQLPKTPDAKLGFLRGDWRGGPGLTDTSGRPIDLSLSFGEAGKGSVTIRRPEDGALCKGPVQGAMRGGKLDVEGSGSVTCQGGGNFAPPHFECGRDSRGQTICNGLNKDGSKYEMDISKVR
ncbi:MAG: hypothetical protein ABI699_00565 [Caldimonas sp.]